MKRVAIIGDSHAEGLSTALPADLNAAGYVVALFEHHRGWSTKALLSSGAFDRALEVRPDLVIVVAGHNDPVGTSSSLARTQAIAKLRAAGVAFRWLVLPASRDDVAPRVAAARDDLRLYGGSSYLDGRDVVDASETTDGVHFGRVGYAKIAQFIARSLRPSFWWLWSVGGFFAGGALVWYFSRWR